MTLQTKSSDKYVPKRRFRFTSHLHLFYISWHAIPNPHSASNLLHPASGQSWNVLIINTELWLGSAICLSSVEYHEDNSYNIQTRNPWLSLLSILAVIRDIILYQHLLIYNESYVTLGDFIKFTYTQYNIPHTPRFTTCPELHLLPKSAKLILQCAFRTFRTD
jgi:hypothetical protein